MCVLSEMNQDKIYRRVYRQKKELKKNIFGVHFY